MNQPALEKLAILYKTELTPVKSRRVKKYLSTGEEKVDRISRAEQEKDNLPTPDQPYNR